MPDELQPDSAPVKKPRSWRTVKNGGKVSAQKKKQRKARRKRLREEKQILEAVTGTKHTHGGKREGAGRKPNYVRLLNTPPPTALAVTRRVDVLRVWDGLLRSKSETVRMQAVKYLMDCLKQEDAADDGDNISSLDLSAIVDLLKEKLDLPPRLSPVEESTPTSTLRVLDVADVKLSCETHETAPTSPVVMSPAPVTPGVILDSCGKQHSPYPRGEFCRECIADGERYERWLHSVALH